MAASFSFGHCENVVALPPQGRTVTLIATPDEQTAIARRLGLAAIEALTATLTLKPGRRGAVAVTGEVTARVIETCVVSLEPFSVAIVAPVEATFAPEEPHARRPDPEVEIERGLDDPDPPEPLIGGVIDLGALGVEFLDLARDPFPRKDGVAFAVQPQDADGLHPFQALAALKGKKVT
jgi:hypothetical protein